MNQGRQRKSRKLREIAEVTGISISTLRRGIKDGSLKAKQPTGRDYVVLEKDLDAFLEGRPR